MKAGKRTIASLPVGLARMLKSRRLLIVGEKETFVVRQGFGRWYLLRLGVKVERIKEEVDQF
jgi:hypothetical protein